MDDPIKYKFGSYARFGYRTFKSDHYSNNVFKNIDIMMILLPK